MGQKVSSSPEYGTQLLPFRLRSIFGKSSSSLFFDFDDLRPRRPAEERECAERGDEWVTNV